VYSIKATEISERLGFLLKESCGKTEQNAPYSTKYVVLPI